MISTSHSSKIHIKNQITHDRNTAKDLSISLEFYIFFYQRLEFYIIQKKKKKVLQLFFIPKENLTFLKN